MLADVILPLPLSETFTYAVPAEIHDRIGKGYRVIVPVGKRKYYTAIVTRLHNDAPKGVDVKDIHSLIDSHPVVNELQLKLWEWISFYYLSPPGDVYKAALPSKLRMESETVVSRTFSGERETTPTEKKIIGYLENDFPVKISQIEKGLKIRNIFPHIYSLTEKGYIDIRETIDRKFTPKTEIRILINPQIEKKDIAGLIGRAKKQQILFEQISHIFSEKQLPSLTRKEILAITGASPAILTGLLQKSILLQQTAEINRIDSQVETTREPYPLNEHQQRTFNEIAACFIEKNTCLLHGITSSGKTEVYIHLIGKMLANGKQTLYLVPEIALTTQLTQRLQAVFGNQLGIYHSRINDNERTEIWQKMLSDNPYNIVIGVRSSLFLPFRQLGLVIVDEEHESSYKQQDPAPRYHARDTAVMLAHLFNAKTLLGSATPSMESYYNAQTGKYGLVTLSNRFEDMPLPDIVLENTRELRRRKKMKTLLSPTLIRYMETALENGEQVILFRNRRGFAPMVECKLCAWTPKCKHCDVSLTYHKHHNKLICHYCGASYKMITECPACHEKSIEPVGMGTEQVEEEVTRLFPGARVARMDTDTTRGKDSYTRILSDFQEKKTHILVGTQMLSKGLDFDNVSVVGIISADSLLNYPDFRSHERGFQLMIQASGRAGRKNKRGTVVIQSADPGQPFYRFLERNDYEGFFRTQIAERKLFHYPPFHRLISITLKDKDEQRVEAGARLFAGLLKQSLHHRVLGPNKPVVSKIQLYHIREILLKLETGLSPQQVREHILQTERQLRLQPGFKYIPLYYDVDPV